ARHAATDAEARRKALVSDGIWRFAGGAPHGRGRGDVTASARVPRASKREWRATPPRTRRQAARRWCLTGSGGSLVARHAATDAEASRKGLVSDGIWRFAGGA